MPRPDGKPGLNSYREAGASSSSALISLDHLCTVQIGVWGGKRTLVISSQSGASRQQPGAGASRATATHIRHHRPHSGELQWLRVSPSGGLFLGRLPNPACAGEPGRARHRRRRPRVDPRVCGGAIFLRPTRSLGMGRPPRMRGSLVVFVQDANRFGSIPACAGEPPSRLCDLAGRGVDPRVCGGAGISHAAPPLHPGRSPRVRGSPMPTARGDFERGSIPACAGEPSLAQMAST